MLFNLEEYAKKIYSDEKKYDKGKKEKYQF